MKRNQGTVIVETAFTVLLFFTFIMAIMEGARLFNFQGTLTNAAREGARQSVAPFSQTDTMLTDGEIATISQNFLAAANIPCSGCVTVTRNNVVICDAMTMPPCNPAKFRRSILVNITATYQPITMSMFNLGALTMHGRSLMRSEVSF